MPINSLQLFSLEIPFKAAFRHHSAERRQTQSLWVEASAAGFTGYGEACPREYVSGEDLHSTAEFFARWQAHWQAELHNLTDLRNWVSAHQAEIDRHPAAWCALELALLDLLAQQADQSPEQLLELPPISQSFDYTAVLGDSSEPVFAAQLAQYQALGFGDFKLKLSGNQHKDLARLQAVQAAGGQRLRVDANNLWQDPAQAKQALGQLQAAVPLMGIEEPLQPARRFAELTALSSGLGVPLIADESCLTLADLEQLQPAQAWVVNLRVSKMGGLLRSLTLIDRAAALGLQLIIGAQVGESSLLTRAALTLAQYCHSRYPGLLLAQEGAFGNYLLAHDIVPESLKFGSGGRLQLPATTAAGWGLKPQLPAQALRVLAV